jgi:hypothetical protein
MSENEKLVERLREAADWPEVCPVSASELREAATALTAAQARIKMLSEALAFYACDGANCDCLPGEEQKDRLYCGFVARQALTKDQPHEA